MWTYAIKIAVTAVVAVAVAEVAKRSPVWAALLASLPLTSILAFVWLYADTGDGERVAELAQGILWLVLLTQNLIAQLITGPHSVWSETVFSIYYALLFLLSGVIVVHAQWRKRWQE